MGQCKKEKGTYAELIILTVEESKVQGSEGGIPLKREKKTCFLALDVERKKGGDRGIG